MQALPPSTLRNLELTQRTIERRRGRKRNLLPSREFLKVPENCLMTRNITDCFERDSSELTCFSDPDTLVTFLIGPGNNPKKFVVHKEVACYHSRVFDAAFNNPA